MPIEEAINLLTDVPARLYGLKERGRLVEGWHADIVVIDPETVDAQPVRMRFDLPDGRAAPLRRRRRHRPRDRERHRDRRPRRVHRRSSRHVAPLGPRQRVGNRPRWLTTQGFCEERRHYVSSELARTGAHADGAAAIPRPVAAPRFATEARTASRSTSHRACPSATSPRIREVVADLLRLHDTMTQRAEAAAIADAYITLSDTGRRNFLDMLAREFWTDPGVVDEAMRRGASE